MKKNKVLKVSMATLALLMPAGYVSQNVEVTPTYAQVSQIKDSTNLISIATTWKYLDNNVDPGTDSDRSAWSKADYQDDNWKSAAGKFGAKKGQLADLGGGFAPNVLLNQYINGTNGDDIPTFFFRTKVNIGNVDEVSSIAGKLFYDDAAIVYINGVKVASFDEPEGGFESNMSYGGSNAGDPQEGVITLSKKQLKNVLVNGENTIAVELHQGRASSSDIYFEFNNLQVNYNQEDVEQKALNLTVADDESKMNITWYANTSTPGVVQLANAGAMVNGQFPKDYVTITAQNNLSNDSNFYYNQATMSNLQENTKYVYRVVNGEKVSDIYDFTTKDFDGSYNFILAGDPQIGASGNANNDTVGWENTLSDSVERFKPNFILSAGDQVNTASNESQYSGYLDHDVLTSVPQATTVGNHDSSSNAYGQHFNLPNETGKGQTTAGGDYWYVYNNTLFMDINTNNTSTAEHKAFMEEAIAANPNIRWKVVVFHHSIYSVASHAVENSILQRREELTPVFDDLEVDVVLMGHDHVYVRSNIMKGMSVVQDTSNVDSVTDPNGILYVTANSASGSKYYNIKTDINTDFVAKMDQSKQRSISNIEVSEGSFKVTTYLYDENNSEWEEIDTFTINKTVIDRSSLQTAIKKAKQVTQSQLDSLVSVVAIEFKAALANAITVNDNIEATQEDVDNATTRLSEALHLLDHIKGDKVALQKLVDTINGLDENKYSHKTWQAMLSFLNDAIDLLVDENALQVDVIKAQEELLKAYLDLRLVPDKQNLNELIKQAESLKEANYSKSDWKMLQTALTAAYRVVNDDEATEGQVNEAQTTLSNVLSTIKPLSKTNSTSGTVSTGDNNDFLAYGILLFTALGCSLVTIKKRKLSDENN